MPALRILREFWVEDAGQDLTEYTLVIVFMVFILFGLTGLLSPYINGMWQTGNSQLSAANTVSS